MDFERLHVFRELNKVLVGASQKLELKPFGLNRDLRDCGGTSVASRTTTDSRICLHRSPSPVEVRYNNPVAIFRLQGHVIKFISSINYELMGHIYDITNIRNLAIYDVSAYSKPFTSLNRGGQDVARKENYRHGASPCI